MTQKQITKVPATMEDLAAGQGKIFQQRGGSTLTLGKIDQAYAVLTLAELTELSITKFSYAFFNNTFYRFSTTDLTGILPDVGTGSWLVDVAPENVLRIIPIEFETFTLLQAANISNIGQRLICRERANAEYILQPIIYVPLPGDAMLASGLAGALQTSGIMTVEKFGAPIDGTSDSLAAFELARSRGLRTIYALNPAGYFLSATFNIHSNTTSFVGNLGLNTVILTDGDYTAINISPSDPDSTGMISQVGLSNFSIIGNATTKPAVIFSKCSSLNSSSIRISGYSQGLLIEGGQTNNIDRLKIQAPAVYVAGSYGFKVRPAITSGDLQEAFTINVSNIFVTGSSGRKFDDCIVVESSDGLEITNGYISWGRQSDFKIDPATIKNVIALKVVNLYLDGNVIGAPSGGADYGLYIPEATGSGVISANFVNCFMGQFSISAIYARNTNLANLSISNGEMANCEGLGVDIDAGTQTNITISSGSRVSRNDAGGIHVRNVRTFNVSDVNFIENFGIGALKVSGTMEDFKYGHVNFENNNITITNDATIGNPTLNEYWYKESILPIPVLKIGGSETGITYTTQTVRFVEIGSKIDFTAKIALSSKGSETGFLTLSLPVAGINHDFACIVDASSLNTGSEIINAIGFDGGSTITLRSMGTTGSKNANETDITDTTLFRISGTYFI